LGDPPSVCATGTKCDFSSAAGDYLCLALGALGGECRPSTPACDPGLACSDPLSDGSGCVESVALGGSCDPAKNACADGLSCTAGKCVTRGALNAGCRATGPSCDQGLACEQAVGSPLACHAP
jgi:hypothetical protein